MAPHTSLQSFRSTSVRPSWLQATLADLDDKMKTLALFLPEEDDTSHSFAERAENYYRKRPQLLALVQDLYNGYLCLADRYCQALVTKHHHHHHYSSQIPSTTFDVYDEINDGDHQIDSDAESSLSYQTPPPLLIINPTDSSPDSDALVADLIIKNVDFDILLHELGMVEHRQVESSRKMELQKSLLDVLESERLILLNENATLVYRASALAEENKGLASEAAFMKRKASDLARCVLKMREDHRVCLLSRKIEDLQGQIYGLEKRNKEYYEQLVRREEEEMNKKKIKKEMALEVCFEVEKLKLENERLKDEAVTVVRRSRDGWRRVSSSRWWDKVKKLDYSFVCGSHPPSTCHY